MGMNGERIYFCVCIANDCEAIGLGPFHRREQAEAEAAEGCHNAHAVTDDRRIGDNMVIRSPSIWLIQNGDITLQEFYWACDWIDARDGVTRVRADGKYLERLLRKSTVPPF